MRKSPKIEEFRVRDGQFATSESDGANGAFFVPCPETGATLKVIASNGDGGYPWEHVSVSTEVRCPCWEEMDFIKRLFWRDDECVMQLHVPRDSHINQHPYCLHLWRPKNEAVPVPPRICV